jgi:hypothetical protein
MLERFWIELDVLADGEPDPEDVELLRAHGVELGEWDPLEGLYRYCGMSSETQSALEVHWGRLQWGSETPGPVS